MGVCDVPVIHSVCNVAGNAAGTVVTAPFDWLALAAAGAARAMFTSVWQVIDTTTYVEVTSGAYRRVYDLIFGIALVIMLGFFALQVIGGMIRREPAALTRAALGLAKSILGSFLALTLLATALEVTDQLCLGIVAAADTNMKQIGDKVTLLAAGIGSLHLAAPGAAPILTIFLAGIAIIGATIVWISLLVRKALLLLAIVFAPIALAGSSWDHTRSWLSRWATFVTAMILSKLVLVVMFLLATAEVTAPIDTDLASVSQPISGVVLMLMAGFAPYLTYKAIGFMGFDIHHAMSAEQEAKSALNRPLPVPLARRISTDPPKILSAGSNGTGGTGANAGYGGMPPQGHGPAASSAGGGWTPDNAGTSAGVQGAGGGSAAAGGAFAAGAVIARQAATAGPRLGGHLAAVAERQSEHPSGDPHGGPHPTATGPTPPAAPGAAAPPHLAETTLADRPPSPRSESSS